MSIGRISALALALVAAASVVGYAVLQHDPPAQQPADTMEKTRQNWAVLANSPLAWTATVTLPKLPSITPTTLGLQLDPTGGWKPDRTKAKHALRPLLKLNHPAHNARVLMVDKKVVIKPDIPGVSVNLDHIIAAAEAAIERGDVNVAVPIEQAPAHVTANDLAAITGMVSSYTTKFPSRQLNRNHNIGQAAHALDGRVLMPGEVFSYNQTVGPRGASTGFKIAPVLVHGKRVPGIGGGICQVSSTLYNAVLFADLAIVSRSRHAIPVHYIPAGRDATVNYGSIDFKFRNSTAAPIAISMTVGKSSLIARILGTPTPTKTVKIKVVGLRSIGGRVQHVPDATLAVGKTHVVDRGSVGRRCSTYREVYENGKLVRREHLSSDYYPPQPRIVAVGSKVVPPKPTTIPPTPPEQPPVRPAGSP